MACRFAQNLLGNCSYTVSSDSLYTDTDAHYSFDDMLASMVAGETVKWALAKATSASTSACTSATYAIDAQEIVAAGEAIRIYSTAGVLQEVKQTDADGTLVRSVANLPQGISIIKINKQSIKITKK